MSKSGHPKKWISKHHEFLNGAEQLLDSIGNLDSLKNSSGGVIKRLPKKYKKISLTEDIQQNRVIIFFQTDSGQQEFFLNSTSPEVLREMYINVVDICQCYASKNRFQFACNPEIITIKESRISDNIHYIERRIRKDDPQQYLLIDLLYLLLDHIEKCGSGEQLDQVLRRFMEQLSSLYQDNKKLQGEIDEKQSILEGKIKFYEEKIADLRKPLDLQVKLQQKISSFAEQKLQSETEFSNLQRKKLDIGELIAEMQKNKDRIVELDKAEKEIREKIDRNSDIKDLEVILVELKKIVEQKAKISPENIPEEIKKKEKELLAINKDMAVIKEQVAGINHFLECYKVVLDTIGKGKKVEQIIIPKPITIIPSEDHLSGLNAKERVILNNLDEQISPYYLLTKYKGSVLISRDILELDKWQKCASRVIIAIAKDLQDKTRENTERLAREIGKKYIKPVIESWHKKFVKLNFINREGQIDYNEIVQFIEDYKVGHGRHKDKTRKQ